MTGITKNDIGSRKLYRHVERFSHGESSCALRPYFRQRLLSSAHFTSLQFKNGLKNCIGLDRCRSRHSRQVIGLFSKTRPPTKLATNSGPLRCLTQCRQYPRRSITEQCYSWLKREHTSRERREERERERERGGGR